MNFDRTPPEDQRHLSPAERSRGERTDHTGAAATAGDVLDADSGGPDPGTGDAPKIADGIAHVAPAPVPETTDNAPTAGGERADLSSRATPRDDSGEPPSGRTVHTDAPTHTWDDLPPPGERFSRTNSLDTASTIRPQPSDIGETSPHGQKNAAEELLETDYSVVPPWQNATAEKVAATSASGIDRIGPSAHSDAAPNLESDAGHLAVPPRADTDLAASSGADTVTAADMERTESLDRRERVLQKACDNFRVDTEIGRATVAKSYDTVREYLAPTIIHATDRMLDDCRSIVAERPDARIVFLGRDGDSIALAARALDPEFFDRHCSAVTVSRCLADTVVQDLEINAGKNFPELERSFRDTRGDVAEDAIPGSRASMTRYLESRGVPVGTPGADIVLIDTSFKGTVQELLSAAYPEIHFEGMYLFHRAADDDPHPGSKTGYLIHETDGGKLVSHDPDIPGELAAILTENGTVRALEQVLRGPLSKGERFGADDIPEQHLESPPLDQFIPGDVSPEYLDEAVRLAVMDVGQLAVADYAYTIAERRRAGEDTAGEIAAKTATGLEQIRSWSDRAATVPQLRELLDSVVRPREKDLVLELRTALEDRGVDADATQQIWQQFRDSSAKAEFVDQFRTSKQGDDNG
jgi:hypothetical protein